MRLVSSDQGRGETGCRPRDRVIDLAAADPSLPGSVRKILEQDALDRVRRVVESADSLRPECFRPVADVRLGPPVTDPSKIICLGLNYSDHAAEQGRAVPERPLTFAKGPNALIGNGDPIPYPSEVTQLDYEAELAVVIGRRQSTSRSRTRLARRGVRRFHGHHGERHPIPRETVVPRKELRRFRPVRPVAHDPRRSGGPHDLGIRLAVNGVRRQSSNTGLMTFKVFYLVHYLSQSLTLEPAISSRRGPRGCRRVSNPPTFLKKGDVIEASIDSLGSLTNTVV